MRLALDPVIRHRRGPMHCRYFLLLPILLTACGESSDPDAGSTPRDSGGGDAGVSDSGPTDSGGPITSDPFVASARAPQLAAAICAHREACEPIYTTYLPESRAECEAREAAEILSRWTAYAGLITARRAGFSAAGLQRCVAAYATAMTDCDLGVEAGACEGVFIGNRASPGACGDSIECAPGNWCTAVPLGCGICVPLAGVGGNCSAAPCASGTECVPMTGAGPICLPNNAALGAECGTPTTGLCRGHLQCVGAGPRACARPATAGMSCDSTGATAGCDLESGFTCDDTDHCAAVTVVAPPAACGTASRTSLCNAASACSAATNQCEPRVPVAGACTETNACAPGLRCEPDAVGSPAGHCRAPLATGAPCTSSAQCSTIEVCINAHCGPLLIDASCN